ncbi:hypothetical protein [Nocardia mexicana]|uniref:Uncharacterized protein n=1 Tax=Nocardia mexicana TaxID=279262 RepID=A0A370GGW0_9NOCA|nr:hypothetical protein [Nocardia mexicana]RDI42907.1 hypothetical protein DFR68_12340 [Nocardia mexicana]
MTSGIWVIIGFVVVLGLPLAVVVGAIWWPERIPTERSVDGIRHRVEEEDCSSPGQKPPGVFAPRMSRQGDGSAAGGVDY